MGTLQGPLIYRIGSVKQAGVHSFLVKATLMRTLLFENEFWGSRRRYRYDIKVGSIIQHSYIQRCQKLMCSFGSSSMDSVAGNSNHDGDYINSSVVEAVEIKSGADGFLISMKDGKQFRCIHNNPQGGSLPDYAPHPVIVLKMEDGSNILLPIIVLKMPSMLLMAAIQNVQMSRPSLYQVIVEMIEKMGYSVKLARITRRVHEAYYAQLYLTKADDETKNFNFDLRPSDAINIAVKCKVPIQVNKFLAYNDGMRIVAPLKQAGQALFSDGLLGTELDRPDGQPCLDTKEFDLLCKMFIAVGEERYDDAARWRDMLAKFRSEKQNWT